MDLEFGLVANTEKRDIIQVIILKVTVLIRIVGKDVCCLFK